ncbi:MAG: ABC transporter permease [Clostridia bacterium]|nr:ABC transporter permease [Clostridia bacterium]
MKRNVRFVLLLMKLKLSRMMMFRVSFFGAFIADGTMFIIQLLAFEAIYSQVDAIGGWNRGQMIIFVGTFAVVNALNMLIYFFGVNDIPEKIKRGDLDGYITKPVSPLLRVTFENVNPGSVPLLIFSAGIVCYGVSAAGINISFMTGLLYVLLVLLMTLLWYDMELILRSIPFLVLSANGIVQLEEQLIEMNFKIPGILYKGGFKVVFYFILPYGIMSTTPTQMLSGLLTASGFLHAVVITAFFTAFAIGFWRYGLRHYKSTGS